MRTQVAQALFESLMRVIQHCVITNINHKGLQRTAHEYAEERRIYYDLISKNSNVDILNSASRILQC